MRTKSQVLFWFNVKGILRGSMLGTYTVDDQIGAQLRLSMKAPLAWSSPDMIAGFDLQP